MEERILPCPTTGCWLWLLNPCHRGYGRRWHPDTKARTFAHRDAYELLVGPIPEGMVLDHRCRVRPCINPAHLKPVTHRTNTLRGQAPTAINARKEACVRGHPFTPENTLYTRGRRVCRACRRIRQKRAL